MALVPYGHFTSMRVDSGATRGLSLHLSRLALDCQSLFDVDLDLQRVREFVRQVVARRQGSFAVRVTVFDPSLALARPGAHAAPRVLVTTRPLPSSPPSPLNVQARPHIREEPEIKHVGLYSTIRQRRLAQQNGFDDALFLGSDRRVLEGTSWNIGFFDGSKVIWPEGDILNGITLRLLSRMDRETKRICLYIEDLERMQAAFATNAAMGVRPIAAINNISFSVDHPIIGILQSKYDAIEAEVV